MDSYKKMIGVLVFIASLSAVYIIFEDAGVKMRIDNDVSKFYIKDGRWLISGEERNKLYSGSKLVYRDARNVERTEEFTGTKGIIRRKTPFKNGAMILDTYEFDGAMTAVETFPVSHTIEIFNASGLIYMYEVKRLVYTGTNVWDVTSPQSFGRNMKVSFSDGYYYSSIYKYKNKDEGRLWVKYRIKEDYVRLDMRLFDPEISGCATLDTAYATYTLNASIIDSGTSKCIEITADHVTLDCQGHTIDGDDSASSYGIYISRATKTTTNITINNCTITDWYYGIYMDNSDLNIINDTTCSSCTIGSTLSKSDNNIIDDSQFSSNVRGFWLADNSNDNYLYNSIINDNEEGIYIQRISLQYPSNCYIYNNLFNNTDNYDDNLVIYEVYFNTTQQTGTRTYSTGVEIGGNYWTNSTGNDYSDTCVDADYDGFCDSSYTIDTGVVDYLPMTGLIGMWLNDSRSDRYYEHNTYAELTAEYEEGNVWLDIDAPGYGANYTNSSTGYLEYDFLTFSGLDKFDDTDSAQNHTADGSFYFTLNKYDVLEYAYVNLTGYNSTNYPKNVKLDVGDDGTDDIVLSGYLNDTTVWLDEVDDATSKNLTYTQAGGQTVYLDIYRNSTADYAKMNFTGYQVYAEQDIEDNYSTSGAGWQYPSMAVDEVWYNCSTYWMLCAWTSSAGNLSITSTAPSSVGVNLTWALTRDTGDSSLEVYLWNFTSSDWNLFDTAPELGYAEYTKSVDSDFINTDNEVREKWVWGTSGNCCPMLSETKLVSQNYPNNISIDTGNDLHVDYSGTTNLSTETQIDLNTTAIQDWLDDECTTVPCSVPISIYTQTSGIIELSDIDVRSDIINPLELNKTAINNVLAAPFIFESDNSVRTGLTNMDIHPASFGYGGTNLITGRWGGEPVYGAGNGFLGRTWNGTEWIANSSIINGLTIGGDYPVPGIYEYEGNWWAILGNEDTEIKTMKWNGSEWLLNNTMINGLSCPSPYDTSEMNADVVSISDTLVLYLECNLRGYTFEWSGTTWTSNPNWIYGYEDKWDTFIPKFRAVPDVFEYDGEYYMIAQESSSTYVQSRVIYQRIDSKWIKQNTYNITDTYAWSIRSEMITIGSTTYLFDVHFDSGVLPYNIDTYALTEPVFEVPVVFDADTYGTLGFDALNISYYGSKAINITAHNDDSSYSESHMLNVRYDNYTSDYPYQSDYLTFWLPHGNAKNIEPVGQSYFQNGTDIQSTTAWDWNWNMSISLNQSLDSCLSLTVKNSSDYSDSGQVINTTARTLWEIDKLDTFGVNWYLDATNCNRSVLGIYNFYPMFESVCAECVGIW